MCVNKKPQSETGNKRLREPHKTRSAKKTSAAVDTKQCAPLAAAVPTCHQVHTTNHID